MDKELFKLVTRRFIAIPLVTVAVMAALFLVVYGAMFDQMAMVTLGGTALFVEMATITGFYFGKKISEE